MIKCRECLKDVSEQAITCPHCGISYPGKLNWDGWGFEYKSNFHILGWPLLHISFKYRPNRMPIPAKGIIAIGQFGMGVINISQFGIGFISVSQVTVAWYALAQCAFAHTLIAQLGVYVHKGMGQFVMSFQDLLQYFLQ